MNRRALGRTGISISPLVLGGNVFGWTANREDSFAILDRFVGAGFEAIDTADGYSAWAPGNVGGESETIIGEWMESRRNREKTVIITKVGSAMGQATKGLSAAHIVRAAEASLARLRTDYIDVYLTHWPDPNTPYEVTLEALQRLIQAGKVRAIGASNVDAAQLDDALKVAEAHGLPRYAVLQPEYNLHDRSSFEGPLQELCIAEGIGVITYFSLARGFLTGKYRSTADLGQSPRGGGMASYLTPRGMKMLEALDRVAARHGSAPAEIALAWVAAQPGVTAPIASATSVAQVEAMIRSAGIVLSAEDLSELGAT